MDDAGGVSGESGVMGDHNDGVAFGVDAAEFFHDDVGGARVEIAGGLVGKDDFGFGDERAGDGDALLLAAGKLMWHIVLALLEMEAREGIGGLDETVSFGGARVDEGEGDIFDDGESGDEIEVLENKADLGGAEVGLFGGGETVDRFLVEAVFARGGLVKKADDV